MEVERNDNVIHIRISSSAPGLSHISSGLLTSADKYKPMQGGPKMKTLGRKLLPLLPVHLLCLSSFFSSGPGLICTRPERIAFFVPGQPYERYFKRDQFGREVTFYISETGGSERPLPLIVYVQGSGCSS